MTITLTPELEEAIAEQARQKGMLPENFALDGLRNLFVPTKPTPDEIIGLAAQVYAGLSEEEIRDVEGIMLGRSHFAGPRQPFEERNR